MRRLRWLLARALALAVGLLAWELALAALLGTETLRPGLPLLARAAGDVLVLLPCSLAALALGARRGGWRGTGGATLVLLLLLPPVVAGRAALAASGTGPAVRSTQAVSAEAQGEDGRFFCSLQRTTGPERPRPVELARDALETTLLLAPAALLLGALLLGARLGPGRRAAGGRHLPRGILVLGAACAVAAGVQGLREAEPSAGEARCPADSAGVRRYTLVALPVDVPLNRAGDSAPDRALFALEETVDAVRAQALRPVRERASEGLGDDPLQPPVLRANAGECVELRVTGQLPGSDTAPALRVLGLAVAGGRPGPDGARAYVLPLPGTADAEGAYLFEDTRPEQAARGLFGVLVVEPAGARYHDVASGAPLVGSSWQAIIAPPREPAFREAVLVLHALGAEPLPEVRLASGAPMPPERTDGELFRPGALGLNFRSEPRLERDEDGPPRALATPLFRSYLGEPTRVRVVHAGRAELHVAHVHVDLGRLRGADGELAEPGLLTAVLGPGEARTLVPTCGAGGCARRTGEGWLHCDMPDHTQAGMRARWRVERAPVAGLAPLPDRAPPAGP